MSRIPSGRAAGSRLPECCTQRKACCPGGAMSRIPPAPPRPTRIPGGMPCTSRVASGPAGYSSGPPGYSRIPSGPRTSAQVAPERMTRTLYAGISRPPFAALSKTVMTGISKPHPRGGKAMGVAISRTVFTGPAASNQRKGVAVSITKQIPEPVIRPSDSRIKKASKLQRFDRNVTAELSRRRNPIPTTTTTTSDTGLLDAVDRLARAQAAHTFAGAVAAAEAAAAAAADPTRAEEAAAEGARCFQAELVDVVAEDVPGVKPIQIIGYVGITRPKYAAR